MVGHECRNPETAVDERAEHLWVELSDFHLSV